MYLDCTVEEMTVYAELKLTAITPIVKAPAMLCGWPSLNMSLNVRMLLMELKTGAKTPS